MIQFNDYVCKEGGDYVFYGWVRGIITKRSGETRYAVENVDGLLLILNEKQFKIFNPKPFNPLPPETSPLDVG